ncbi:MAG: EFR1 family ferrodoxin [Megasphaera sp.]|jgi:ferredoxin|nr:EFR1 family ferrodoxin [Megasphaera sp.]
MILYFSGTGNSLVIAKKLADTLGDTAVHISDIQGECMRICDKSIGFVFPVYFGELPDPVRIFAEYVKWRPSTYFYGVATCGSMAGRALLSLKKILEQKDCTLSYGKACYMISNSTIASKRHIHYDFHRLDGENDTVSEIARAVQQRVRNSEDIQSSFSANMMNIGWVKRRGLNWFRVAVQKEICVRCGICEKVCPNHNITTDEEGITIGNNCSHCLACVHWCPQQAMLVRNRHVLPEDQYHHPGIQVEDLFRK